MQIVSVYRQCASGDLTLAQQILALPLPENNSTRCQAGAEPAELDGDMSDDEEDVAPQAAQLGMIAEYDQVQAQAPQEASDWTTVKRSGRR